MVNRNVYSTNDEFDRKKERRMEKKGWLTPAGSRPRTCCGQAGERQPGQQRIGQRQQQCDVPRR